ncbi:flagellar hook-basal body complex protein [Arenimonas terrae]|uniref:Flagellar hook protein FlgE n=1 Tax=Arenimonas terrae TaxID=2546226 RepID=A0A5C4RQK8_9GAMM|nr:flagellar hook-basal body complex protein [Arenimonas terrae]TNJ33229.1 flagellar hook-basal body complex protein [Arenimonas terrae]
MFQALFNSLSGLFSFSRSLNTVSNNITNMNTPGFRGSDSYFANLSNGRGTHIDSEGLRTTPGEIRQTRNATDLAIEGDGFFILTNEEGDVFYSRAGQFVFKDDILVDAVSGHRVMGYDSSGRLTTIDRSDYRSLPALATTGVHIRGNILPVAAGAPAVTTNVNGISVFDAAGGTHVLTATFTSNSAVTPGSYLVTITNAAGVTVGTGEVRFDAAGSPIAGFSSVTANLSVAGGTQAVTFNLGTPGMRDGMTSNEGMQANLTGSVDDGHGILALMDMRFDEEGVLQFAYSQSEERSGPRIALAGFSNESEMLLAGGRLVSGGTAANRELGRPGEGRFGKIAGGHLEMSNVNLTQEFADMIIIQRGYQASSRVMSVSNEMLEQLYNSTRGG